MATILDCPTTNLALPEGPRDMWLLKNDVLVVNTFRALTFVDVKKPRDGRIMHQRPTRFGRTVRTRVTGDVLVCAADEGVEVLDVSNPESPREVDAVERNDCAAATFVDGKIWLLTENGVSILERGNKTTAVVDTGTAVEDGGDLVVSEKYVAFSSYEVGVHVLRRVDGKLIDHGGAKKNAYSMTHHLELIGDSLIDVGDSDAFVRFSLEGASAKKLKATRVSGTMLAPQAIANADGTFVVVGKKEPDELVIAHIDVDGAVTSKETVKGFVKRQSANDSMRGLVRVGDTLLVASFARRLVAVSLS